MLVFSVLLWVDMSGMFFLRCRRNGARAILRMYDLPFGRSDGSAGELRNGMG